MSKREQWFNGCEKKVSVLIHRYCYYPIIWHTLEFSFRYSDKMKMINIPSSLYIYTSLWSYCIRTIMTSDLCKVDWIPPPSYLCDFQCPLNIYVNFTSAYYLVFKPLNLSTPPPSLVSFSITTASWSLDRHLLYHHLYHNKPISPKMATRLACITAISMIAKADAFLVQCRKSWLQYLKSVISIGIIVMILA